jgi:hypothetical protein
MTTYSELRAAFLNEVPRRAAVDKMLRELPAKMVQAISDYLRTPSGTVGLCCPVFDQMGHRTWQACENDYLGIDRDGIPQFGISINTAFDPDASNSTFVISANFWIMYFQFIVEKFDEKSVELRIENLDGAIPISNAHDPASYADAAKLAIDRLMDDLKNPKPMHGSRAPIGFGH